MGISENLLRLSVGIEDYRDPIEDPGWGVESAGCCGGLAAYRRPAPTGASQVRSTGDPCGSLPAIGR